MELSRDPEALLSLIASAEVAEFGRRAGLRIQWSNPWGFESPLSHRVVSLAVGPSGTTVDAVIGIGAVAVLVAVGFENSAQRVPWSTSAAHS